MSAVALASLPVTPLGCTLPLRLGPYTATEAQLTALGARGETYARETPAMEAVFQMLLAIGGLEVARQEIDATSLARYATRTRVLDGARGRVMGRRSGRCHDDALAHWKRGLSLVTPRRLMTGWALGSRDGDGIWRRHSWTLDRDDRVCEPTRIPRDAYVGVILTTAEVLSGAW